jgi:hypothetical protein
MILVEADSETRFEYLISFPILGQRASYPSLQTGINSASVLPPIRVNSPPCPSWSSQELQGSP